MVLIVRSSPTAADSRSAHDPNWTDPEAGKITLKDYSDRWLKSQVGLRPKARLSVESLLRSRILPSLGTYSVGSIRHSTVTSWLAELEGDKLSVSRIRQAYGVLSRIRGQAPHGQASRYSG